MSIDKLQEKIRKMKNPSVVDFCLMPEHIVPHIQERNTHFPVAYEYYCTQLLEGLREIVPAVRFSLSMMTLYGSDGLVCLENLLRYAHQLGYYVLLDCPDALQPLQARRGAELLLSEECNLCFDALVLSAYIGSDGLRPYCEKLKAADKDLFVTVRTGNKSASELQDLLTGSRLVHMAMADVVNRFCEPLMCKCGYSQMAAVVAAPSAQSIRTLRSTYRSVFLLIDGYDYPNANAKNCSGGFDVLGHGAVVCANTSITAAWQEYPADAQDFVRFAQEAALRMKKNVTKYVTIL